MASGFGLSGGRNRCFGFFQDFLKCYAQADKAEECRFQFEDYKECLWHRKEITRLQFVEEEWKKQNPEQADEGILPRISPGSFAKLHGIGV